MANRLKQLARSNNFFSLLYHLPRLFKGYFPVFLDYPPHLIPRYGYGRPAHRELHDLLARGHEEYRRLLNQIAAFGPWLTRIPMSAGRGSSEPAWRNPWFSGMDMAALYGLLALNKPALCVEVGSGHSTKVMRRAINDHKLHTRLVSIDPHPRTEIDGLCDEVIRKPLEENDRAVFAKLGPGDFLFLDGSHRSFMNSDVTVFFLEILPSLPPGVLVHLHDIHLPFDYPPERAEWYYTEQYVLAASLLAGHQGYDVLLPNTYCGSKPDLARIMEPLCEQLGFELAANDCLSFWLRTK